MRVRERAPGSTEHAVGPRALLHIMGVSGRTASAKVSNGIPMILPRIIEPPRAWLKPLS